MRSIIKVLVYFSVILFSGYVVYLNMFNKLLLSWLCVEDGRVENMQAIFYLATTVIFFYLFIKITPRNKWHLLFAILFLWMTGEEVSWGQRIFGIDTSETLSKINVQHETNIHNINGIHQNIRLVGSFGILLLTVLMPITNKFSAKLHRIYHSSKFPVFPLWASGIIIVALLFSLIPRVIYHVKVFELDEISELILSFSFFLFAVALLKSETSSQLI